MTNAIETVEWAFELLKLQTQPLPQIAQVWTSANDIALSNPSLASVAFSARDIIVSLIQGFRFRENEEIVENIPLEENATPFQRLLVLILGKLSDSGMKRRKDGCYYQLSSTGIRTMAWVRGCSIREFILQHARRETAPDLWRYLTSSRENLDVLCKHLCEVEYYVEFPTLLVDPGLISWQNGTYSLEDNVFWGNSCLEQWPQLAQSAQNERIAQGWGDSYLLKPPDFNLASCHILAEPFRICNSETESDMLRVCAALRNVGIADEFQWWFFALMGRAFFPLNKHERWHIVPYIKTNDAIDQAFASLFATFFAHLLGPSEVGTIGSGTNTTHSPETIMNTRVAVLLMRDAPPMEQGDWQSATCGETVCINPRGRSSYSSLWNTHLVCVGARMPYKNDAATVERRVVMFDASIAHDTHIATLKEIFCENADLILQTCVDHYLTAVHRYGDKQLWEILPAPFYKLRDALREITNPLYSCLRSNLFEHNKNQYMPLSDFKDIYQSYRRNRGLQPQRWIRDHWHATFVELNLTIERGQRDYRGSKSTTEWVLGIDCVESTEHSAVITTEIVEQLETEKKQCRNELDRVTARHSAASSILGIDKQICVLKQQRAIHREEYRQYSNSVNATTRISAGESNTARPADTEEEYKNQNATTN